MPLMARQPMAMVLMDLRRLRLKVEGFFVFKLMKKLVLFNLCVRGYLTIRFRHPPVWFYPAVAIKLMPL
jgi:hypothetical protein